MAVRFFQSKTKPTEIIAFMALFSALDAVLAMLCAFFPFGSLLLTLVIPLSSVLVALLCPLPYLPLFVFVAFSVCMGASFWNFQTTIFYVAPALISGALYGLCERKGIPSEYNLFVNAVLDMVLFVAAMFLVSALYDVSMFESLLSALRLQDNAFAKEAIALLLFAYGLAQALLNYFVLQMAFQRMKYQEKKRDIPFYVPYVIGFLFTTLGIGLSFVSLNVGYFCLGALIYWAAQTSIFSFPYGKKWLYIALGISLFLSLLLFAGLYRFMPSCSGLLLTGIPLFFLLLCNLINVTLKEKGTLTKM